MIINFRGKKLNMDVKKMGTFGKYLGLMFKSKETKILLFDFEKQGRWPIHSYFVFFDFLAVWLDDKNQVLECRIVKPFTTRVVPEKNFVKLIEIPLNSGNDDKINFFVGKRKV